MLDIFWVVWLLCVIGVVFVVVASTMKELNQKVEAQKERILALESTE